MPTFPLAFFRAFSHSFCSKAIWAIFHLYIIQIYERAFLEYKSTVHQLSLKYLYLNEKISKCNTVWCDGGENTQGRIYLFTIYLLIWVTICILICFGHVRFLNDRLHLLVIKATPDYNYWESVHFSLLVIIHMKGVFISYLLENP